MFKRLFTIKFNNKDFLILVNEEHRYAFMEIKDNKLVYPDIEDFKQLFNIFNVDDGILSFKWKGERLDEKVDYRGILLSILLSANIAFPIWLDIDYLINKDNSLIVKARNEEYYRNLIEFKSVTDLNAYLGYRDISKEEVFDAIDNNEQFNDGQREITKAIIEEKIRINPDIDLRIIYENLRELKIEYRSLEELKDRFHGSIAGCYCPWENTIYLSSEKDELFAHEISHVLHHYYRVINGKVLSMGTGRSQLDECMTNREGSLGLEHGIGENNKYKPDDERMLDFLLYATDKFDLSVYDEYGLNPLIDELKEKYPDVDIDYIIDYFNAMHDAYAKIDQEVISMFESDYLLEQTYEIAISKITEDDMYTPLDELHKLFLYKSDYCDKYNEMYYKYLLDNSFIGTQEYDFITKFDHLILKDRTLYLGTNDNKYCNEEMEFLDVTDDCIIIPIKDKMKDIILNDFMNGQFVFDDEYISSIMRDGSLFDYSFVEEIKDYSEDDIKDIIDKLFFNMVKNCETLEEIQGQYLLFIEKFNTAMSYESNYMNVWSEAIENNTYFNYYCDFCIEKEFVTEKDMKIVRDTNYIVEYNGNKYLVKSIDNITNTYDVMNESSLYFNQVTNIPRSEPVTITYLDIDGSEKSLIINREVFISHKVKDRGKIRIQSYLENCEYEELSQDFINSLMEECNVINNDIYANVFTFTNGEVVYDGILDESFYVEFGKNENGEITYRISKYGNVIYQSCENFVSMTTPIKYKTFIDSIYFAEDNYLDEVFSDYGLNHAFYTLKPIMKDVKITHEDYDEVVPITDENDQIINYKYIPHVRTNIDFIKPVIVNLDGQNYYARDIVVFVNVDDEYIYICYPDGSKEQVIKIEDVENYKNVYDGIYYLTYLEEYLDQNDIVSNDDGIVYLTREQLYDMIIKELNKELNEELNRVNAK